MKTSFEKAIQRNIQYHKYRKLRNRIRLLYFEYEDSGKLPKAEKVLKKIESLLRKIQKARQGPKW